MAISIQVRKRQGFTLLEVTIVIALIILLSLAFLALFNPKFQIEKSWDSKRKRDLSLLFKVFEEYYNDKSCYPRPAEVCYDSPQQATEGYVCHICGREPLPPDFTNFKDYLSELPCDPQHPTKKYLYQIDDLNCPSSYRIYAKLSNQKDQAISEVGCQYGCGVEYPGGVSEYTYNYGVSSPNVGLEQNRNLCSNFNPLYVYVYSNGERICNNCGSYLQCSSNYPEETFYIDSNCATFCVKD